MSDIKVENWTTKMWKYRYQGRIVPEDFFPDTVTFTWEGLTYIVNNSLVDIDWRSRTYEVFIEDVRDDARYEHPVLDMRITYYDRDGELTFIYSIACEETDLLYDMGHLV